MKVVGLLLLAESRTFDVAVAAEVWGVDRAESGIGPFELRIASPDAASQPLSPVGHLTATHDLGGLGDCDLVVVPGRHDPHSPVPAAVRDALRAVHHRGTTIAALCSGAFTLAAAGLLDGHPATTHWRLLQELTVAAPAAEVRGDVLFTADPGVGGGGGAVFTSAGVVGGIDLCLHLVRQAHGADVAAALARRLVMPPVREGGQRQYTDPDPVPQSSGPGIAATLAWAAGHPGDRIGVGDLAIHAGMSARTFHRAFLRGTGTTPGRWLTDQRVQLARRLLETTDMTVDLVAERAGLGTAANLRRRLRARTGVSPDTYRRTFNQGQRR